MIEPWIASCRLRAASPDSRRWDGDTDFGEGLLITSAEDAASYAAAIRARIEATGLLLDDVTDAGPLRTAAAYARHRAEIDQSYWQINETGLLLVSGLHPFVPDTNCAEAAWDDLLARGAEPLWGVIDGVNWPEAPALLESRTDAVCLYASHGAAARAGAPWLVRLSDSSPVTAMFRSRPHERHSGILLQSKWICTSCASICANSRWSGRPPTTTRRSTSGFMTRGPA
ncbi:DUF4123 domain-containing protein [Pelagivirga sediminicola]|uniref:DUF4123 domain-containing protein n=1 Tax=Pelagivirga sediminicola TaxID=2170575 RepID=UPI0014022B2D|nr:DUF4123 domain-containing protein [Pelagivirga sediminicola]